MELRKINQLLLYVYSTNFQWNIKVGESTIDLFKRLFELEQEMLYNVWYFLTEKIFWKILPTIFVET